MTNEEIRLRERIARLVVERLRRMDQLEEQASIILALRVKNDRLEQAMRKVRRATVRVGEKSLDGDAKRVA